MINELRTSREQVSSTARSKEDTRALIVGQTKAIKIAESELSELRQHLRSREETIDRLMVDLSDEKLIRERADATHRTKIGEYIARFESMKRELSDMQRQADKTR